jgi:hypothetical protein
LRTFAMSNQLNNRDMSKARKYPNGYLPKIAYHAAKGNIDSMLHFVKQQTRLYGPITDEQKVWMKSYIETLEA